MKTLTIHVMKLIALFALILGGWSTGSGCSGQNVGAAGDGSTDSAATDGSEDPEGDGSVDGSADGSVECGDPDVLARYPACLAADDEASCLAAGGHWGTIGIAPYEECQCPTGQSSCPCTRTGDCRSSCVAEFTGDWDCAGITSGHCSSVSITVGCWCLFFEDGHVEGWCVD